MKKSIKILIIVAVSLLVAGAIVMTIGFATTGFNFKNPSGYEEKTYNVEQQFSKVTVSEIERDVRFAISSDGSVKIKTYETEKLKLDVKVEDGVLKITRVDEKKWYEFIGVNFGWSDYMATTVYLPAGEYDALNLSVVSGDVNIPNNFTFETAIINSVSGDVKMNANCKVKLEINTVSGEIDVSGVTAQEIKMNSVSGDIEIENSDASVIDIESTSGDVDCAFNTGKSFLVDTVSGDVRVPQSDANGGTCKVETTSGDIEIRIN